MRGEGQGGGQAAGTCRYGGRAELAGSGRRSTNFGRGVAKHSMLPNGRYGFRAVNALLSHGSDGAEWRV
jgi:hypothetical protein